MTAEVLNYPPCWYLGHYECQRQTFAENDGQNEDDDDYNGKDSNHDDEVKVDCENQKLLWYVVGSPKVQTFYTRVPSIRGDVTQNDSQRRFSVQHTSNVWIML